MVPAHIPIAHRPSYRPACSPYSVTNLIQKTDVRILSASCFGDKIRKKCPPGSLRWGQTLVPAVAGGRAGAQAASGVKCRIPFPHKTRRRK